MILPFSLISTFAIACLIAIECSASSIYSSIALGLCSISDIQDFLRSTNAEIENVRLQKVLAVCDALNSSLMNTDNLSYSDILEDLDVWFDRFVRDNHLNEDGLDGEKPLTLKKAFKFFISALPSNVGSELFQIKPAEQSKFAKLRVLDDAEEKYVDDSLPAFLTMTGSIILNRHGDHSVQKMIKVKSRNIRYTKRRSHPYKLEMIFAQQSQGYCSIFPLQNENGIAGWKVLSVRQDNWTQKLHFTVHRISDSEFTANYSNEDVLYIYRRSGGQFGKEAKSVDGSERFFWRDQTNQNLRFSMNLLHAKPTLIFGAIWAAVFTARYLQSSESFQVLSESVISGFTYLMNLSADDILSFAGNAAGNLFCAIFSVIFLWMIAFGFAHL